MYVHTRTSAHDRPTSIFTSSHSQNIARSASETTKIKLFYITVSFVFQFLCFILFSFLFFSFTLCNLFFVNITADDARDNCQTCHNCVKIPTFCTPKTFTAKSQLNTRFKSEFPPASSSVSLLMSPCSGCSHMAHYHCSTHYIHTM